MKWFKKKVDERQEMDILRVEHIGFWVMYWMLLAAMVIQGIFMEDGRNLAAGEWIVFMTTSIIVLIGWIRKGVWSFYTRKVPGVKSYLIYSLIGMFAAGMPLGLVFGMKWHPNDVKGVLSCVIYYMILMFVMSFILFFIGGTIAKKREAKLANQVFDDSDDEEDL